MIAFWVTEQGSFGLRNYRSNRGKAIADRFEPRLYEDIRREVVIPSGAQIFTALDQLTAHQRDAVAQIWDAHARVAPELPRLNDPRRVLLRFELLTRLQHEGLNTFRVYGARCLRDVQRFPVFVRHIHFHNGPATGLLHTPGEVLRVLTALRLRGRSLNDYMIVEFCDASGPDGLFRKYAAFKVADRIIPCHVFASRDWCVKSIQNEPTLASVEEGIRYIEEHPHEAWLRRVFAVAGTDYGRVDYGVADGVPQVWEINLNPTIGRAEGQSRHTGLAPDLKKRRDDGRELFHQQLRAAFLALDRASGEPVRISIDEWVAARAHRDAQHTRRRQQAYTWLKRLYDTPGVSWPVRAVYSLFPRR